LAIAQAIVINHQGQITVESQEGVGTTFTVTLPFAATLAKVKNV
jgi:OmpR-family two-component system manganese-sensing sensor histidine kinase